MAHVEAIQHAKELLTQYNHYAAIRQILADDEAWQNLKEHNGRIFAALEAVLLTENSKIYPTKLYDNVYSVLVFFSRCWPRNNYDHPEGQPRAYQCIYSLDPITNPVYTSTGLIMEAKHLPEILKNGKNPLNRQPFNQRDIDYMKAQAAEYKMPLPKTKKEKFNLRDVGKSIFMASTTILFIVLAFTVAPLLTGFLFFTALAVPLITAPLSYLLTHFWFKHSTAKKTAGFSDKIAKLISLNGDSDAEEIAPALPVVPEYERDQPGLPRKVGEVDHPEVVMAVGEPNHPELSAQPQQVLIEVNSNRRQGMLNWLNKIEPALHKSPEQDEQPGLSINKR